MAVLASFLAKKEPMDGFPTLNNEFLTIRSQKKWGVKKRYHKCIKYAVHPFLKMLDYE